MTRPCCPPNAIPTLTTTAAESRATIFKALGDATRLQMLSLLANAADEVCVCQIQEQFALGQPTISHHLKILDEAGLVKRVKRGLWVFCEITPRGQAALGLAEALV